METNKCYRIITNKDTKFFWNRDNEKREFVEIMRWGEKGKSNGEGKRQEGVRSEGERVREGTARYGEGGRGRESLKIEIERRDGEGRGRSEGCGARGKRKEIWEGGVRECGEGWERRVRETWRGREGPNDSGPIDYRWCTLMRGGQSKSERFVVKLICNVKGCKWIFKNPFHIRLH